MLKFLFFVWHLLTAVSRLLRGKSAQRQEAQSGNKDGFVAARRRQWEEMIAAHGARHGGNVRGIQREKENGSGNTPTVSQPVASRIEGDNQSHDGLREAPKETGLFENVQTSGALGDGELDDFVLDQIVFKTMATDYFVINMYLSGQNIGRMNFVAKTADGIFNVFFNDSPVGKMLKYNNFEIFYQGFGDRLAIYGIRDSRFLDLSVLGPVVFADVLKSVDMKEPKEVYVAGAMSVSDKEFVFNYLILPEFLNNKLVGPFTFSVANTINFDHWRQPDN